MTKPQEMFIFTERFQQFTRTNLFVVVFIAGEEGQ